VGGRLHLGGRMWLTSAGAPRANSTRQRPNLMAAESDVVEPQVVHDDEQHVGL
jgi:hypothetical protein